ncbi:hypothetical protein ACHAPE_006009 [Trichoderma viride]
MSARAIESRIAPRNLTIADIAIPKNEHTFGTFDQNSSSYEDALACLRMYRKQVTQLNYDQRYEIVHIITEGHFFRTRTAMKSPMGHKFYRHARESGFAAEYLSWPEYIIMRALYKDDLPSPYVDHIEQTFGTAAIEDFSYHLSFQQRKSIFAQDVFYSVLARQVLKTTSGPLQNAKKLHLKHEIPDTPTTVHETLIATPMDQAENDTGDKALTSVKEATQQQNSTSAASNAAAFEVTPSIDLDARDILDRLPSKTSGEGSKRIDKASWDRLQYLLGIIRETTILNNIRLKALEGSHRDLESKLGTMTTAFDTMNTTIETIVTEARADREGYNHVLSSIKDVMVGMADSIKDIKEQL